MWEPIETAPKDGTSILVYEETEWPEIFVAYHKNDSWGWTKEGNFGEDGDYFNHSPSHWMPLPNPPEPKDEKTS